MVEGCTARAEAGATAEEHGRLSDARRSEGRDSAFAASGRNWPGWHLDLSLGEFILDFDLHKQRRINSL